jgi:hypothetical protein
VAAQIALGQAVEIRRNVDRIAELIGFRTISAVDISGGKEPIRYKDFRPVKSAKGKLANSPLNSRKPLLLSDGDVSRLRTNDRKLGWYSIQVIGDAEHDFEPLVALQILAR